MIAFEVLVNDHLVCRAGSSDLSVLTAIVAAAGKLGPRSCGSRHDRRTVHLDLDVAGLTARLPHADDMSEDEHLDWAHERLAVGDEVRIRLMESNAADEPRSARPANVVDEAQRRIQFEWAKAHYFANRSKYEKRRTRRGPST